MKQHLELHEGVIEVEEISNNYDELQREINSLWGPDTQKPQPYCNKIELIERISLFKAKLLKHRMSKNQHEEKIQAISDAGPQGINARLSPTARLNLRTGKLPSQVGDNDLFDTVGQGDSQGFKPD